MRNVLKLKFPKHVSQDDFYQLCRRNDDVVLERDEKGNVLILPLKGGEDGNFNAAISAEIGIWNRQEKKGKAFDSSTGFTLPDNSVRGPDSAWIAIERWKVLPKEDRKKFAHISPDFVIEIRSVNDSLEILKDKMLMYVENGVRLGWLIDPQNQQTFIYRLNGTIELISSFETPLSGEDVLEGFELRLSDFWEEE